MSTEQNLKISHEYITMGPDLYMRQYWPESHRDCWLAKYETDEEAIEAAHRWNERRKEFDKVNPTTHEHTTR